MMKFLSFCAAATAAMALYAAPEMPVKWKSTTKAKLTTAEGILRVASPGRMGGISGAIKNIANQRVEITAMVRGQGQVRPAVLGSYGWAYGSTIKLNDEFQQVKVVYTDTKAVFTFTIFSLTPGETSFEIKDIKAVAAPAPELIAADIPGKLFVAVESPARHGKVQKVKDALDGKAVWGKRYYHVITLPVPTNANDLYYYCHVRKDSVKTMGIQLKNGDQTVASGKFASEEAQWQWVKVGPVKAVTAYPEADLTISGDAKTTVWVDKVVLSTDSALTADALNTMEN